MRRSMPCSKAAGSARPEGVFAIPGRDDVRECMFAATRNAEISSYGEPVAHAGRLRFILPPASSASAESFSLLASSDAEALARAKNRYADTRKAALRESLSADDTVAPRVSFSDPANFALVRELGGHLVPVIDRSILRAGRRHKDLLRDRRRRVVTPAKTLITACTPLAAFMEMPERVADAAGRRDHEDPIKTISALDRSLMLHKASLIEGLLRTAPRRCGRWASRRKP
jgi:hypothetical protein